MRKLTRARATTALLGAALIGLLTSCTQATPSGTTISNGVVTVIYRPCVKGASVGELKLYDVTDFSRPPVWSARLSTPARGKLEIPITSEVPGYTISDRLTGPLDPNRNYRIDGQSEKGVSWEGPTFKPLDLRPGKVRESGHNVDLGSWVRRSSRCGGVGAAMAGSLVVAVMVGLALVVVAMVRRRRRGPVV